MLNDTDLLNKIHKFVSLNKDIPYESEIQGGRSFCRRFGSFQHAVLIAGYQPKLSVRYKYVNKILHCLYCKKETKIKFKDQKFCSQSCSASYYNLIIPKRQPEGFCKNCKKACSTSKTFCTKECRTIFYENKPIRKYKSEYRSGVQKIYRLKRKLKAVNLCGGKCIICGYNKCTQALDFHHLNPKEKEFNISQANNVSWARIESELGKCVLLCRNCHAEVEAKIVECPGACREC